MVVVGDEDWAVVEDDRFDMVVAEGAEGVMWV